MLAAAAHAADSRPFYLPQPVVAGDFELGLGVFDPATGPDLEVFTGTGRVNVPVRGTFNLGFQTSGFALHQNGASMIAWTDAYGHAWHRLPSSAWGVFGGTQFGPALTHTVGVEAKHYLGNVSLGGEAAYLWRSGGADAWEVAGAVNLYLHPNFRIGGAVQYISGFAADLTTLAVDAELRLRGSPWSVWGYATSFSAAGSTSYAALGGFKVFLDAPGSTLQSHEMDVPFWFHAAPPL
jgi:hypothetical protein